MLGERILYPSSYFILFWHSVSNVNFAHFLFFKVFLHEKKCFLNCFGHVYDWALVHWAFNLPKVIMHALIWEKNQSLYMCKRPRFIKTLNKSRPSMLYMCINFLIPYPYGIFKNTYLPNIG
jgi:hypothetical protein